MSAQLNAFVSVSDGDWYEHLSAIPNLDEVNFWLPSSSAEFRALGSGEPLLFKLHSPRDFIVCGGLFAHFARFPVSAA
jgi:putative restriction endonuclease